MDAALIDGTSHEQSALKNLLVSWKLLLKTEVARPLPPLSLLSADRLGG